MKEDKMNREIGCGNGDPLHDDGSSEKPPLEGDIPEIAGILEREKEIEDGLRSSQNKGQNVKCNKNTGDIDDRLETRHHGVEVSRAFSYESGY